MLSLRFQWNLVNFYVYTGISTYSGKCQLKEKNKIENWKEFRRNWNNVSNGKKNIVEITLLICESGIESYGIPASLVGKACKSWSWSQEFKPHIGHRE